MILRASFGLVAALAAAPAFGQASFGPSGYSETFDSMGTTGTAPPTGWRVMAGASGSSNSTWTTSIPAGATGAGSISISAATNPLTATTTPSGTNNNGFNAAFSASATSDRVLATSPTTVSGTFVQLALQNNSGSTLAAGLSLTIDFDTVRFTSASTANQLPGYWVFISQDAGTSWTNIGPNPTITTVPNTVGVTATSLSYVLPSSWTAGSTIHIRWIDDNAQETSPDQIIGLNNVRVVPTPGAGALALLGLVALRRRR